MRSILALTVSTLALAGCVTENSYDGSNRPVVEKEINNSGAARTRIALALQYLKTGNNSQAKYNLERAADFAPDIPEVHYSLAYYYQQVDEPELADKAYQRALKIAPNDPNTLNNYGVFLCGIGEYDRAAEEFLKAIAIPSYIRVAESYENLALCAIEFDDFDNAEKYLKSALNHSSQRASSLITLAGLHYAKSDLHKAESVLEKYESTGRVTPRALMLSYLIQQRMGHIEKAEKTAGIILQTYPGSSEAKIISLGQNKRSEFEILREKYRQAQLEELQISSDNLAVSKEQPKIRIVKKKVPQTKARTGQSTALSAESNSKPAAQALATTSSNDQQAYAIEPSTIDENKSQQTAAKIETENTGFKTVTSTPKNSNQAVDTSAVVSALSVDVTPQTTASVSLPNTKNDDVTIVSFGEPQSAYKPEPSVSSNQVEADSSGSVVFYEAQKDESVFSTDSGFSSTSSQPSYNVSAEQVQLPMLNPSVPALNIPYHIIQNGENLFSISVRYNVKLQQILQWNGFKESDRVENGTKVYLNDPNIYHTITEGDTLYSIATQHGVLIDQLMRWNKLSPDVALEPGHRLLLVDPDSYSL